MTKITKIEVKRPNGIVETVDVSETYKSGLTDAMFAKMAAATKAAGRGDMLSYSVELSGPSAEIIEENNKIKFMTRNGFSSSNF